MADLGRLVSVELRSEWQSEAGDFTPWLAQEENIKLLGETIGLELEVQTTEKEVGPFRADILCKETTSDHWVLIENQLEKTDHTHLGQLITYAAGLDAVTIVWVAQRFTDEHRAALDWLNEVTGDEVAFFALEVELWRIGDSPAAPKFNVTSQPNDWSRNVRTSAAQSGSKELTEFKQMQLEFWTHFKTYLDERTDLKGAKPYPANWMNISLGRAGFRLSAIMSQFDSEKETFANGELRTEFAVENPRSKEYWQLLEERKESIENAIGEPVTWYEVSGVRTCRIFCRKAVDVSDSSKWPDYWEWLRVRLVKFNEVFRPIVSTLEVSEPLAGEDAE